MLFRFWNPGPSGRFDKDGRRATGAGRMSGVKETSTIHGHSGWLIPLGVFVVTAALSGAVLLYYLAPPPASLIHEHPTPTVSTAPVSLSVGGVSFSIPSNYIRYGSARRGGASTEVALFTALPDFRGYSEADAQLFAGNQAKSPVVYILLHDERMKLSEMDRLTRVYLGYVTDPGGKTGPFGLAQYAFRDDSGYRGEDLFVGRIGTGLVVLRCVRLAPAVQSPSCLRETRLARHAAISYRFKRAQLASWREIATGVDTLMHSFMRRK